MLEIGGPSNVVLLFCFGWGVSTWSLSENCGFVVVFGSSPRGLKQLEELVQGEGWEFTYSMYLQGLTKLPISSGLMFTLNKPLVLPSTIDDSSLNPGTAYQSGVITHLGWFSREASTKTSEHIPHQPIGTARLGARASIASFRPKLQVPLVGSQ